MKKRQQEKIEELLTELLVIKDIYICGRMNQAICHAVVSNGRKPKKSKETWQRYEQLSSGYIKDSIAELFSRGDDLTEILEICGPVSLNVIFDSSYQDFDSDLVNEMMLDFYGGRDSVGFASAYNYYAEDFNAFLAEFISN
jgi:hypothetical protein